MKAIKALLVISFALMITTSTSVSVFAQTAKSKVPKTDTAVKKVYSCPMDPEVVSNKPGKCPKCGMDLVEKKMPAKKKESAKKD